MIERIGISENESETHKVYSKQTLLTAVAAALMTWGLPALVCYALARSLVYAALKPLWFDEVLTYVVSRQGSLSAIWAALRQGVDGNPPAFYLMERGASFLAPNEHVGYRLPSVCGFACTLIFLFIFVKRRHGVERALLCSSVLLITPLFTLYAEEARPYSLVTALIALAMVCYQRLPAAKWAVGLCFSLVFAALLHHYAVMAFLPFFLAELSHVYYSRQTRLGPWLALLIALGPLTISWPMLMWMKHNWGPHFWVGATLSDVSAAYGSFFRLGAPWGVALCGMTVLAMLATIRRASRGKATAVFPRVPISEHVLLLGLVVLPIIGFAVARATHGPFVERYFLAAILGIVVAAIYGLDYTNSKSLPAVGFALLFAISAQEFGFWKSLGNRERPADIVAPIANLAGTARYQTLPIVISDAGEYVEFWHYAPPALLRRVVTFPNPEDATIYAGVNTVDKLVLALRSYVPAKIQDFPSFEATHPAFLLYSNGSRYDWWPAKLAHDGYQLELLSLPGSAAVYLVGPKHRTTAID
jgi:4-amino-4-deoxy-L-arabinose transferase-like glycosyltransferase